MQAIRLRRGTASDAGVLSGFAARVFREAFAAGNDPADLETYMAEAFTVDRQRSELEDAHGTIILAEERAAGGEGDGGVLVGYAHLVPGDIPTAARGVKALELKRCYVARPWQGRGVADALMGEVLRVALERAVELLWLGVWERNHRAIAFYRRHGFTLVGEHTFLLGRDAQTDHIMSRLVGDGDASPDGSSAPPGMGRPAVGYEAPPR
ncbi:MAG TPA: GNAT family N-acetyltransferase [Gemmatimonadaceae bacterium]|nr:GNAT family N-acetyltransferase [Gemmatimonadaceae bacterium]